LFTHNIYRNLRVRAIIVHDGKILILPRPDPTGGDPPQPGALPGGGLEPNETLAEAAARETYEEFGLRIEPGPVAFLREWVVPKHCPLQETKKMLEAYGADPDEMRSAQHAYGLEVFLWARLAPEEAADPTRHDRIEGPAKWVPFERIGDEPVFPKELRALARELAEGRTRAAVPCFATGLGTPWDKPDFAAFQRAREWSPDA
jgi:8-oxo-dGTP pyrophosphatase MutT (NUDIX family)